MSVWVFIPRKTVLCPPVLPQYAYATGSTNTIHPTTLTYTNGLAVTIGYGTTGEINDYGSRVDGLIDGANHSRDF